MFMQKYWSYMGVMCVRKLLKTIVFLIFDVRFSFRPHRTTLIQRVKFY